MWNTLVLLTSFEFVKDKVKSFRFFIELVELKYVLVTLAMVKYIYFFEYFTSIIVHCLIDYLQ